MGTMVAAVLASIVVSLIVTRLMTNIFLKELEGIDDAYREKLTKVVIDVIENKKGAQELQCKRRRQEVKQMTFLETILWVVAGTVIAIAVSASISAAIAAKVMNMVFKALEDDLDMIIKNIKTLTKPNKQ